MRFALKIALLVPVVFAIVVLFLFDPQSGRYGNLFPPCPFHKLTGLYCPGCGSLRALHDVLHGHLLQALDHNALAVVLMPFVLWYLIYALGIVSFFPKVERWAWHILVVIVLFWILRNLPFWPFYNLSP